MLAKNPPNTVAAEKQRKEKWKWKWKRKRRKGEEGRGGEGRGEEKEKILATAETSVFHLLPRRKMFPTRNSWV